MGRVTPQEANRHYDALYNRSCHESPTDDYAAHFDELYAAWLARGVTANVIEGEEFDTDSDPGDEA